MSLALLKISLTEFNELWLHLTLIKPGYRCMHLRRRRTKKYGYVFAHLHAMHANIGTHREIEGMISGPDGYWHYKLTERNGVILVSVIVNRPANADSEKRVAERFVREVSKRIKSENRPVPNKMRLNYTSGEYYLRRGKFGPTSLSNGQAAISSGVLDPRFVAQLPKWRLRLVRGH